MDDAGIYLVKAINIEGEAKCSSTLTILPSMGTTPMNTESVPMPPTGFPPEFLQLFTDRQTALHSAIKFEARLIGTSPLHVGLSLVDLKRRLGLDLLVVQWYSTFVTSNQCSLSTTHER